MEEVMDSLRVASISIANYGLYIAEINLLLQMLVAMMTVVYLGYKIKHIRRLK